MQIPRERGWEKYFSFGDSSEGKIFFFQIQISHPIKHKKKLFSNLS